MTLRLAKSPEAPNSTTVTGSLTPEFPLVAGLASTSISSNTAVLFIPSPVHPIASCTTLYLNTAIFQFRPQLLRPLIVNRFKSQLSRIFQVQRPVIYEHAFPRRPLRHLQRDAIYHLLRLSRVQITRTEKYLEVPPQMKRLDSIFVQLQRFVVDRPDKIFFLPRQLIQHRPRFRILLRLREHERDEFLARERPGPVKQDPIQVFVQRNQPGIERRKRKVMPVLKLFPIQMKRFRCPPPRARVPPVSHNDPADVPKERGDFRQGASALELSSDAFLRRQVMFRYCPRRQCPPRIPWAMPLARRDSTLPPVQFLSLARAH